MSRYITFFICLFFYFSELRASNGNTLEKVPNRNDTVWTDIDSIYSGLRKGRKIQYQEIPGRFEYFESNAINGKYVSKFISKEFKRKIVYTSHSDDKSDSIAIGNVFIALKSKMDPTTINLFQFSINTKRYFAFIGKAQSASGSGTQMSFCLLVEVSQKLNPIHHSEFQSRFGSINSLVDYDMNGTVDYYKIVNAEHMEEYSLTINSSLDNRPIKRGHVLLRYQANDKFCILQNMLEK